MRGFSALEPPDRLAFPSLRFALERRNTAEEVKFLIDRVPAAIDELTSLTPKYIAHPDIEIMPTL
jgi:cysteine sulfinate desulfinase/cysteine desulfurase-like protein